MKHQLQVCSLLILSYLVTPAPTRAAPPPAPQAQAACFSILSLPCIDCPGVRSKFCTPDPTGGFQSCSETMESCNGSHHCSQVQTSTGPACGN